MEAIWPLNKFLKLLKQPENFTFCLMQIASFDRLITQFRDLLCTFFWATVFETRCTSQLHSPLKLKRWTWNKYDNYHISHQYSFFCGTNPVVLRLFSTLKWSVLVYSIIHFPNSVLSWFLRKTLFKLWQAPFSNLIL